MPIVYTIVPDGAAFDRVVVFRECKCNHAASLGRVAHDGCIEFVPGNGDINNALKCAACGCHRNFHRKCVIYYRIAQNHD